MKKLENPFGVPLSRTMPSIDTAVRDPLEWVFDQLDDDGSGFIEEREGLRIGKWLGGGSGDLSAFWLKMKADMDSDGDGKISKQEFVTWMATNTCSDPATALRLKEEVQSKLSQAHLQQPVPPIQSHRSSPTDPVATTLEPVDEPGPVIEELMDPASGATLLVSIPPSYRNAEYATELFNVAYVLDEGIEPLAKCSAGAHSAHMKVARTEGRAWHPELIVVGLKAWPEVIRGDIGRIIGYLGSGMLTGLIESKYRAKPYAAARALCGCTALGASLVHAVLSTEQDGLSKIFRYHLLGAATTDLPTSALPTSPLPEQTQIFLTVPLGSPQESAVRALETSLAGRLTGTSKETTMFVTREGAQTYTDHVWNGPSPVTLDAVSDGMPVGQSFATRGMLWLGERLEAQKIRSLGGLLPWHEFK